MKTLTKIALAALIACSALATQAGPVRGYVRSNGTYVAPHYRSDAGSLSRGFSSRSLGGSSSYVYRNPYAATPSVGVSGYTRSSGTYVAPHVRTAPNWTPTDNLNYRGFGTIRVPKSSLGSDSGFPSSGFAAPRTLPAFPSDFRVRPLGQ